mmetsp:Transcript_16015/g.19249  ORF Transcript_16015/g.19249 Transcript_16015/m.19249 type:complete len:535 (+) Transcript_16015:125-1729(+)|eukprot:CAMPEP_0195281408 /NCGR_PEP_ID=MMETSP0707-20130614/729_1 /TAXON_ID=33640 /ORGANISM="Asterionellopsis glacialis, Strain CCMP134" /LENGTH=534 /DNA_ID=CAMNT_0040340291 /DNA_START=104 /DNA_END=1708 /DNA_ORIENTATION=-
MMATRPSPTEKSAETVDAPAKIATKKKSPTEAVEDLERRLAMLGGTASEKNSAPEAVATDDEDSGPSSAGASAGVKGGKSALLARIMAAQERAKKAQQQQEEAEAKSEEQLLPPPDIDSVPNFEAAAAPPPAFEDSLLPPPAEETAAPPPSFDAIEHTVMDQVQNPESLSAPQITPTAPAFEDLLDSHPPPVASTQQPVLPPTTDSSAGAAGEGDDLWAGMGEEERKAMMDEQRRIMETIESEKAANAAAIAAAQAENFDLRSGNAAAHAAGSADRSTPSAGVPAADTGSSGGRVVDLGGGQQVSLHGQEKTKKAIADGTAALVQCMNCSNWMQVTDNATLMYCPVCSVVSPVVKQDAVLTREEATQLTNDRKLAEQLQKQEYEGDDNRSSRAKKATQQPEEEGWWDSITSVFSYGNLKKETVAPGIQARPPAPGEVGVSRPPGSPSRVRESEGLLGSGGGGMQSARVAERQPLFSCVVDSVSSAATSMGNAIQSTTLSEDQEGNIHGIDASGLLSVTSAGREQSYHQLENDER